MSRSGLIPHLSQNRQFKESTTIYAGSTDIAGLHLQIASRVGNHRPGAGWTQCAGTEAPWVINTFSAHEVVDPDRIGSDEQEGEMNRSSSDRLLQSAVYGRSA